MEVWEEILAGDGRVIFGSGTAGTAAAAVGELLPEGSKIMLLTVGEPSAETVKSVLENKYRVQEAALPDATFGVVRTVVADEDVRAVVGAGGSGAAEAAKFAAAARGLPLVFISLSQSAINCLAPNARPVGKGGMGETYRAAPPVKAIFDPDLMPKADCADAAGLGEICSRLVALFDVEVRAALGGAEEDGTSAEMLPKLAASLLSSDCSHETIAAHAAAASVLIGSDPALCHGGEARMARVLDALAERRGRAVLHGENSMTAACAVIRAYLAFLTFPHSRTPGVPDNNLRMSALSRCLGVSPTSAARRISAIMSADELAGKLYALGEYRCDLVKKGICYEKILSIAQKRFKRLYKDAGYSYNTYLSPRDMRLALALAPDLPGRPTLLGLMKQTGGLDRLLTG